jgi:hypothetical protein
LVLAIARESVRITTDAAQVAERSEEQVERFKKLRQASLANGFNVSLMSDLAILAILFPFVSLLIARESKPEMVGWFSDRDALTTWCDGVMWNYATENVHGLAERLKVDLHGVEFMVAGPDSTLGADTMWFDEFVRLADYFAGTLAAWDIRRNLLVGPKFVQIVRDVIADAANVAILRLAIGDKGMGASRLAVTKKPTLHVGAGAIAVSRKRLAQASNKLFKIPREQRARQLNKAAAALRQLAAEHKLNEKHQISRVKRLVAITLSQGVYEL